MKALTPWNHILRRLRWDIIDPDERKYYAFAILREIPGRFGELLRARFLDGKVKRCGLNVTVKQGCRFRSLEKLELGNDVVVGVDNFFQAAGGLIIKDGVRTSSGVRIWTANHNYAAVDIPVVDQGGTEKPVVVGNGVIIESNVFILPGAQLGDGCVVRAGSVIAGRSFRPGSVLAGNPARAVGARLSGASDG